MSGDLTELMQHGKLRVKDKVTGAEAELSACLLPSRWRYHDSVDLVAAMQMYWGGGAGKWLGDTNFLTPCTPTLRYRAFLIKHCEHIASLLSRLWHVCRSRSALFKRS